MKRELLANKEIKLSAL